MPTLINDVFLMPTDGKINSNSGQTLIVAISVDGDFYSLKSIVNNTDKSLSSAMALTIKIYEAKKINLENWIKMDPLFIKNSHPYSSFAQNTHL